MTSIMQGFAKGEGALKKVDQGITKVIEEDEHEILGIQVFTPMPSNDKEGRNVPLSETFVNTS
jgi:hypothetical protein